MRVSLNILNLSVFFISMASCIVPIFSAKEPLYHDERSIRIESLPAIYSDGPA